MTNPTARIPQPAKINPVIPNPTRFKVENTLIYKNVRIFKDKYAF